MSSAVSVGVSIGSETFVLAVSSVPGRQDVVADDMGERATPLYVSYAPEEVLFGGAARNAIIRKPKNTVHAILAMLSAKDASAVKAFKPTCKVEDILPLGKDGEPDYDAESKGITLPNVADHGAEDQDEAAKSRTPADVAHELFTRLRVLIGNACGPSPVGSLVVAVPRDVDADAVLQALRRADVVDSNVTVRVVPADKCIAAAANPAPFTPGFTGAPVTGEPTTTLVIDWGANGLRVSAIAVRGSSLECVGEASVIGKIGCKQLDAAIADGVATAFHRKTRLDPREEARSMRKLTLKVADAKMTLSASNNTSIELEAFCQGVDLALPLSRMNVDMAFDTLEVDGPLQKTIEAVIAQVADAKAPAVGSVALAGGMCRVPRAQSTLKAMLMKLLPDVPVKDSILADEATAIGACIAAQTLPDQRECWKTWAVNVPTLARTLVTASHAAGAPPSVLASAGTPLPVTIPVRLPAPATAALGMPIGTVGDTAADLKWHGVAEIPVATALIEIYCDAAGSIVIRAGPDAARIADIATIKVGA